MNKHRMNKDQNFIIESLRNLERNWVRLGLYDSVHQLNTWQSFIEHEIRTTTTFRKTLNHRITQIRLWIGI